MIAHEYEYDENGVETDESFDARVEATYRPNPAKPWRVAWGFGAFQDFATPEEAREFYAGLPAGHAPQEPFNAVEAWA